MCCLAPDNGCPFNFEGLLGTLLSGEKLPATVVGDFLPEGDGAAAPTTLAVSGTVVDSAVHRQTKRQHLATTIHQLVLKNMVYADLES